MAFVRLFRSRTRRPDFAMETEAAVNFAKATSGRLSSFSNALAGRGSGTPQAGGVSGFDSLRCLQHGRAGDGAWQTFCAYFPLEARLVPTEQKPNFRPKGQKHA
jgi:hypothetical protein